MTKFTFVNLIVDYISDVRLSPDQDDINVISVRREAIDIIRQREDGGATLHLHNGIVIGTHQPINELVKHVYSFDIDIDPNSQ